MSSNTRLFLWLWFAGMAGVLSLLLVDLDAMIAMFPMPEGTPPPELPPPALLKLVTVIQPAVLTSFAVIVGMWLAPKIGLHAPAAEAFAKRQPIFTALRPQIIPGLVGGLGSGIAIVLAWILTKPHLGSSFIEKAEQFNKLIPHALRILYGGFTEEILLRWGVMTFLVWMLSRLFQATSSRPVIGGMAGFGSPPSLRRGADDSSAGWSADGMVKRRVVSSPRGIYFVTAIVVSAFVFGAGHLPVAYALAGSLTLPIVLYVIIANAIFGIVGGLLYWRRGLESAMLAHMSAHVILIIAIYLAV